MTSPILLAFCAPGNRERVFEASFGFGGFYFAGDSIDLSKERLALLSIGPEGGAELAQWVDAHGLDGVTGIGFVGVTAPWAEQQITCRRCGQSIECAETGRRCRAHFGTALRLSLGPLEPLRAVAERARRAALCDACADAGRTPVAHSSMRTCPIDGKRSRPVKFVIACVPDDGVCSTCRGIGDMPYFSGEQCKACDGEGKALSSAEVARELAGTCPDDTSGGDSQPFAWERSGGLTMILYPTRVALAEHGLRAVIERLTQ